MDLNYKIPTVNLSTNVLINVFIVDHNIERNVEWNLNDTVESLKFYILKLLPELDDPLNHGFFLPAHNGRNGKFLQEERLLNHYLTEVPFKLELRKKVRIIYSSLSKPKKINTKPNQKQFIMYIRRGEIMKINKMLSNGLDPNFHVAGMAEIPLSLACRLEDPHKIIMSLVNNGAYLDFRATDSLTALHKVAKEGLIQPMKTLLQLGQSPNCKDNRGLTPLYYCIENDAPPECVNILLYEHSNMGVRDEQGFQEIHKACLYGRTAHLDHLLSYGADIDAKNNKGSTALHICALHNQGSCARLLLYRGIMRHSLDSDNKSAYQTALLSNNIDIADLIQTFKDEDVVPVTNLPKFNEKRRSMVPLIKRFSSASILDDENEIVEFNESARLSAVEIHNIYGSVQCLTSGNSYAAQNRNQNRNSQYCDSQSLKIFANPTLKPTGIQVNTWNSPAHNLKSNPKPRIPIASIMNSKLENIPRIIVLQRGPNGFGFVIRGIKNENEIVPKPNNAASNFFESITENSPAHQGGLLAGDYLLEVNNTDVHEMSHENVVKIIQMTGDCLTLKVITINPKTASTGIFDCTDSENPYRTNLKADSQSIISGNNISIGGSYSSSETMTITVEDSNVPQQCVTGIVKVKNDFVIPIKPSLMNVENQKNLSVETNVGLKKPKFHAPPPPVRNETTILTTNFNNSDYASKIHDDEIVGDDKKRQIDPSSAYAISELPKNNYPAEPIPINKSKHYIPPPDYNSDNDIDSQSSHSSKSTVLGNTNRPTSNNVLVIPPPPIPIPPPIPSNKSQLTIKNVAPVNRMIVDLDKEILNVNLKPISQNVDNQVVNESGSLDHNEALKFAVLNHRKKIESGESQSAQIESKLKESKVGNKSLIFEANTVITQNNANDKQPLVDKTTTKSFDFTEKHAPVVNDSKNLDTSQKLVNNGTKTPVPTLPKPTVSSKPALNETHNSEVNLRLKAEALRSNLLKKEKESKKGTLYFTNEK